MIFDDILDYYYLSKRFECYVGLLLSQRGTGLIFFQGIFWLFIETVKKTDSHGEFERARSYFLS